MRLILAALLLSSSVSAVLAVEPSGLWWIEDHTGIIEIAPCDGGLCGRIVGQERPRDAKGNAPQDWQGRMQCGLQIIRVHPTENPDMWAGIITNPRNGQDWRCEIHVGDDGDLRLRGYLLTPILGETQTWRKFSGQVSAQCDIR